MQEVDQLKVSEAMQEVDQLKSVNQIRGANRLLAGEVVLKGRVPQIKDWLDALCTVSEKLPFRKQERLKVRKHAYSRGLVSEDS